MSIVSASAKGVDRRKGHYTVYVPSQSLVPSKYVVYDNKAEARAAAKKLDLAAVYTGEKNRIKNVYGSLPSTAFSPPSLEPLVELSPKPGRGGHQALAERAAVAAPLTLPADTQVKPQKPGRSKNWLSSVHRTDTKVAKKLGPVTSGSLAIGAVSPAKGGADVEVHV